MGLWNRLAGRLSPAGAGNRGEGLVAS